VDPRIAKTRQRLQEALFELVYERGIDDVSVSDIAQRAAVNRTTFYLHYSDKETLLADALDLVASRAGASLDHIDVASAEPPAALTEFLEHVDAYAGLYHRVFTEPGYGVVLARLRANMIAAIERLAEARPAVGSPKVVPGVPVTFVAAGVAGSILGVLGAWLDDEKRVTAAELAGWIWAIVPLPAGSRT